MGIFFSHKVEHRHGSKKVSRKTTKIEMKIKQEELKQLKQQRRQQQWMELQQRVEQQQVQQQYAPTYAKESTININEEVKTEVNQTLIEEIHKQQTKLTELLTYKEHLKANSPNLTKLESFVTIMTVLIFILTFSTIIIPFITVVVGGCILNNMDTEHNRHGKELTRVNNEIKATQKLLQELKNNII